MIIDVLESYESMASDVELLVDQLEFGCPFKPGSIGEKDAEAAERTMIAASVIIKDMYKTLGTALNCLKLYKDLLTEEQAENASLREGREKTWRQIQDLEREITQINSLRVCSCIDSCKH